MIRRALVFVICFVAMGLKQSSTSAQPASAPFERQLILQLTVLGDGLLERFMTEDIEILSQDGLAQVANVPLSINEHFAEMEIVEAATIKADGRRIEVGDDRILTSSAPNAPVLGIFRADVKIRTIVFPDVAVGDRLHYAIRVREKARGLPGGFSFSYALPPSARFRHATISLDVPADLALRISAVGLDQRSETSGGRRRRTWTLPPHAYRAEEYGATAPMDRGPHLVLSSYRSWEAIAETFYKEADAKSEAVPEVRRQADLITSGITDRREQARAIFDWVSRNIRYFGIFLGNGGYIPRSAATVLVDKYGDCKDHVTLMRALLAAKGIDADFSLISLAPTYRTFEIPTPEWFNHVILYLPEFDVYADPTSAHLAFGVLLWHEADKPVLRVGKHGALFTRTRALSEASNQVAVVADVTLRGDGTATGRVVTTASGAAAAVLRQTMAQAERKGGEVFARELLTAQSWRGGGRVDLRDPLDHAEPYAVRATFTIMNPFFGNGPNRNPIPAGPSLFAPVHLSFAGYVSRGYTQDFQCVAATYMQSIDLHLPNGQSLARVPDNVSETSVLASYTATYRLTGQTLHVERRFVSSVMGQACTSRVALDINKVARAAAADFGRRLVFSNPGVERVEQ